MKKIILLIIFFTVLFSIMAQFPEGFESGLPPVGWTSFAGANGLGNVNNWEAKVNNVGAGSKSAFVDYESVAFGETAEDWLVTPQFTPTETFNVLSFIQRQGANLNYGTTKNANRFRFAFFVYQCFCKFVKNRKRRTSCFD